MIRRPVIGVMGSGNAAWADLAEPLAKWIAEQGFHLLTGGGGGVMAAASAAFCNVPGRTGVCIGVVPTELDGAGIYIAKPGYPNPAVELPIVAPLGSFAGSDPQQVSRNHINVLTSTVVVALPGGKGTRNEVELASRYRKPVILFGPGEQFAAFPAALPRTEDLAEVARFILTRVASGV